MQGSSSLRICLTILVIAGLWVPQRCETSTKYRWYYYAYSATIQSVVVVPFFFFEVGNFFSVWGNAEQMLCATIMLIEVFIEYGKIFSVVYHRRRILHLLRELEDISLHEDDSVKISMLEANSVGVHIMSRRFLIPFACSTVMLAFFPVFRPTLMLPLEYPHVNPGTALFAVLYVLQVICTSLSAYTVAGLDLLIGGLMYLIAGQSEVLAYQLSTITRRRGAPATKQLRKKDILFSVSVTSRYGEEDREYAAFIACVKNHNRIIRILREVEDIFSLALFSQFTLSAIIMCATLFSIATSTAANLVETVWKLCYICCVVVETLLFCYYGDKVKEKNQALERAAYGCGWEECGVRARRCVLVLLTCAQRTQPLKAGGLIELSVYTFSTILRSTYSFFTLVYNGNSEEAGVDRVA